MKASLFYLPSIGSRAEIEAGMAGMNPHYYQRMLGELTERKVAWTLDIVGDGGGRPRATLSGVTYHGPIRTERELAARYGACDVFVSPATGASRIVASGFRGLAAQRQVRGRHRERRLRLPQLLLPARAQFERVLLQAGDELIVLGLLDCGTVAE